MDLTYVFICLPSSALPASGSMGIISALCFWHPLSFDRCKGSIILDRFSETQKMSVRKFCITILGHGHSRRDGHRAIHFKPRHVATTFMAWAFRYYPLPACAHILPLPKLYYAPKNKFAYSEFCNAIESISILDYSNKSKNSCFLAGDISSSWLFFITTAPPFPLE
jgi:hypothetical protein